MVRQYDLKLGLQERKLQPSIGAVLGFDSENRVATLPNPLSSVINFGASGDGETDDTAKIQAAVDASPIVLFPPGTYVTGEIAIPTECQIVFQKGAKLIPAPGITGTKYFFRASGTSGNHFRNILIQGAEADCDSVMAGLVRVDYTDGLTLDDCQAYNCSTIGALALLYHCSKAVVDKCYGSDGLYGIAIEACTQTKVINSTFENLIHDGILFYNNCYDVSAIGNEVAGYCTDTATGSGGKNGRGGIQFYGGARGVASGNLVRDAAVTAPNDTGGIRFRDFESFACTGNQVYNTSTGILCNQIGDYVSSGIKTAGIISGNDVVTCLYSAINIAGNVGIVSVSGNYIEDANTLDVANIGSINASPAGTKIEGNMIVDNIAPAIYSGGNNQQISGNTIIRCGKSSTGQASVAVFGQNTLVEGNNFIDDRVSNGTITCSSTPSDGDTCTINGTVITFKTTVSDPATQVAIGSTRFTAASNLKTYLVAYPIAGFTATYLYDTVTLTGTASAALTITSSGSWASTEALVDAPIATLAIRLIGSTTASATVGVNHLGDGVTTYCTVDAGATWKRGSTAYIKNGTGNPSVAPNSSGGTFEIGCMAIDSNGVRYQFLSDPLGGSANVWGTVLNGDAGLSYDRSISRLNVSGGIILGNNLTFTAGNVRLENNAGVQIRNAAGDYQTVISISTANNTAVVGNSTGGNLDLALPNATGKTGVFLNGVEKARFDQTVTANDTSLLLWDVTAGSLRRVTIGAADSGGTGYRVLRIPN